MVVLISTVFKVLKFKNKKNRKFKKIQIFKFKNQNFRSSIFINHKIRMSRGEGKMPDFFQNGKINVFSIIWNHLKHLFHSFASAKYIHTRQNTTYNPSGMIRAHQSQITRNYSNLTNWVSRTQIHERTVNRASQVGKGSLWLF